jgi:homoserine dehydrogenase
MSDTADNDQVFRIGLLGHGTVGAAFEQLLGQRAAAVAASTGMRPEITGVLTRSKGDFEQILGSSDLIVELIGGLEPARDYIRRAMAAGKHVVTANKQLLSQHGEELWAAAREHGVQLRFEAAVAGVVPVIRVLGESLAGAHVDRIHGIVNGTTNYILSEMATRGCSYAEALADAQRLGYAEADPTLDIGGGDTAHKLTLLASLAFGTVPDLDGVSMTGIDKVSPADIAFAGEFGYRLKLLGVARRSANGIEQVVHPAMVPARTPLADVESSFNAVSADAGEAGTFFFQGRGAGRGPTSSAVVSDLVDVARGAFGPTFGRPAEELVHGKREPAEARLSAYYMRFQVLDVPGVMAEISRHLANEMVSIESMIQRGRSPGEPVAIVMITHETQHVAVVRALKAIAASDKVCETPCMIPMEAA